MTYYHIRHGRSAGFFITALLLIIMVVFVGMMPPITASAKESRCVSSVTLADGSMHTQFRVPYKMPLDQLQQYFPEIVVMFSDGTKETIRVSWKPTEDYAASRLHWMAFYPVLPGDILLEDIVSAEDNTNGTDTSVDDMGLAGEEVEMSEDDVTISLPYAGVSFACLDQPESGTISAIGSSDHSTAASASVGGFDSAAVPVSGEHDEPGAPVIFSITGETNNASPAAYDSNEWKTYTFLRTEMGLSHAAACGIMANIYAESAFRADTEGDHDADGNPTSYGICQWHGQRMESLIRYCHENGYDYTTIEGQLHYLQEEADGTLDYIPEHFPLTMTAIRTTVEDNADGAFRAGYLWCSNFERPYNVEATSTSRGNLARDTFYPQYQNAVVMNDVAIGNYYYEPVYWALGRGITSGIGGGNFGTTDKDICTRAQIVTFLYHAYTAAGGEEISDEEAAGIVGGKFTDIPASAYYYKPVAWAVRENVTSGKSETEFAPDDPCTRAQAMTFLWNAMGRPAISEDVATAFTDVDSSAYYAEPVRWAVANGITSGVSREQFGSRQECTRVQIVTFLYRTYHS